MLKKRVEILFEPLEYRRLEEVARARKRSVGSLVREAVAKYCVRPTEEERRRALQWLQSQTFEGVGGDWEQVKEEIAEERMRQIEKSLEAD
ncbi:MAG TPA: hypothetical protein VFT91_00455 [Dehalococcoidia bacterium]|nr:hypothetical protein [Dehalococcoidia bacterium]